MAINIGTLKTRAFTALIFVAVMLVGLLWNEWSFLALLTLVHFGCWYEWINLLKKIDAKNYIRYSFAGLLYITMPIVMMIDLGTNWNSVESFTAQQHYGKTIPIVIIFSIWVNDTMAYLVGSFIGKTPFSKISPKKTWEGTIGGVILCILAIGFIFPLLANRFFNPFIPRQIYFIIAGICAVFGTAGDLLESKLKRIAGIKDSGSVMPGHGGFLDRFDSFLVATPFVWAYLKLFV
ncbi:MAG: phosphatidate cytidylyltransferase [Ferruginibacter sp.]|nr:phosphatidate cytidylyltransferase [Ferruginibacter sp.]